MVNLPTFTRTYLKSAKTWVNISYMDPMGYKTFNGFPILKNMPWIHWIPNFWMGNFMSKNTADKSFGGDTREDDITWNIM